MIINYNKNNKIMTEYDEKQEAENAPLKLKLQLL
jgi:hypothetical protein